jgi:hypothetical protein
MNDIASIIKRMERVEELMKTTKSKWAQDYWATVWNYFHRQLKYRGYK